jgi:hypothetical protein
MLTESDALLDPKAIDKRIVRKMSRGQPFGLCKLYFGC